MPFFIQTSFHPSPFTSATDGKSVADVFFRNRHTQVITKGEIHCIMSTSSFIIMMLIGIVLKVLPASIPTKDAKRLLHFFQIHQPWDPQETDMVSDQPLNEKEQESFLSFFNNASFLKQHYVFPGKEDLFLHPTHGVTPYHFRKNKKNREECWVYVLPDCLEVVRKKKKKVTAYQVRSAELQQKFGQ